MNSGVVRLVLPKIDTIVEYDSCGDGIITSVAESTRYLRYFGYTKDKELYNEYSDCCFSDLTEFASALYTGELHANESCIVVDLATHKISDSDFDYVTGIWTIISSLNFKQIILTGFALDDSNGDWEQPMDSKIKIPTLDQIDNLFKNVSTHKISGFCYFGAEDSSYRDRFKAFGIDLMQYEISMVKI